MNQTDHRGVVYRFEKHFHLEAGRDTGLEDAGLTQYLDRIDELDSGTTD